jgi:hypothetical protein
MYHHTIIVQSNKEKSKQDEREKEEARALGGASPLCALIGAWR